jgi:uncharacterized protein YgfB (UPF0149 family)
VVFVGDPENLQALAATVVDGGLPVSIAALHGAACGFAVFDGAEYPLYEFADLLDPGLSGDDPALARFVEAVHEALTAEDFGFTLLLPDEDDAEPEERLEALGLWCGSFLQAFGAGLARLPEATGTGFSLPDEIQEIVDDLAAIAEVDPESAAEDDAGDVEGQLVELEEFVKVGVLLIASVMTHGVADQDE